jgi:hypothetical protein
MKDQDDIFDLGNCSADDFSAITSIGTATITLDPSLWNGDVYAASGAGTAYNWSQPYATTDYAFTTNQNTVSIDTGGLTMAPGTDITVGGKSLTKAIEKIEERLGILNPNPELEDRWEQLKELRRQYMAMENDILEKEKIMNILKG